MANDKGSRLYLVVDTAEGGAERIVDAANASQAIRHVVKGRFTTTPASARVVARLVAQGVKVEKANEPEAA